MKDERMTMKFGRTRISRELFEDMPCPICATGINDYDMQKLAEQVESEIMERYPDIADEMFRLWVKNNKTEDDLDYLYNDCDGASTLYWELLEKYAIEQYGAKYYEDLLTL